AALTPRKPPTACLSPIAPAIAGHARSQLASSRTRVKSHVVVAPHISRAPSTPSKWGFTWASLSESRIGLWLSSTMIVDGRSSRRFAIGHLLHLEFRNSRRVVPVRGQDPVFLVVPRKAANLRLDQLQAPLVAQVRPMLFEMRLEARGPFDQSGEVLGDRELR